MTPHLFIFDLTNHIHVITFAMHWMRYWANHNLQGHLTFLLADHALTSYPELHSNPNINLIGLTPAEKRKRADLYASADGQSIHYHETFNAHQLSKFAGYYEWEIFCKYSKKLDATDSFLCYIDRYLPMIKKGSTAPRRFSGLYLRPMFHYPLEMTKNPTTQLRQKFFLSRALRHPHMESLFVIDPNVLTAVKTFDHSEKVAYLPEPAELPATSQEAVNLLKTALNIELGETVFLIFGHLSPRKGIEAFLKATYQLPTDLTKHLHLLLVGACAPPYQQRLNELADEAERDRNIQVTRHFNYVPEEDVASFFTLADVVVTLYQDDYGPSNVNLLAATTGTPVLSASTGFKATFVERWQAGLAVDPTHIPTIAEAIAQLMQHPFGKIYSPHRLAELARQHTAEEFCRTFFRIVRFR